jgi:hypothetical protein
MFYASQRCIRFFAPFHLLRASLPLCKKPAAATYLDAAAMLLASNRKRAGVPVLLSRCTFSVTSSSHSVKPVRARFVLLERQMYSYASTANSRITNYAARCTSMR